MDKPPALDPKMKAIYDQVMGTVVTPPTQQPTTPITPRASAVVPQKPMTTFGDLTKQQPLSVAPNRPVLVTEPTASPLGPSIPVNKGLYGTLPATPPATTPSTKANTSNFVADDTAGSQKHGSPITPILLTLSGLVFFVVYTIFWLKFFNIPIPFLPI